MSRWVRQGVSRADAWEEGYDLASGSASASLITAPLTKTELAAYRRELRERDERRRTPGFAPWPEDEHDA